MLDFIIFLIGLLLGGIIGIIVMCLMQINHLYESNSHRKDDDE